MTTNTEQLKPCPFCGAQPEGCDVGDYFVSCPSCGIDGPSGLKDGQKFASEAWNRRALALPTADHIPDSGQMVQPAAPVDEQVEALARKHGTGGWQTLADMVRFGKACMALQPSADVRDAVLAEREAFAAIVKDVCERCRGTMFGMAAKDWGRHRRRHPCAIWGCGMTTTPQTEASRLVEMADELERVCHDWTIAHIASAELRRLVAENSDLRERNAALGNAQEIALDTATEHALRADELRGALATAEAERDQLARWKSTNAPRLEALDGLLADARAEAAKGAEAISSLASEREANAILTAENDQLRAQVERLRGGEPVTLTDEEIEELQWRVPAARNSTADDLQIRTTRQMTLFARAIEAALREKGELR